MVQIFSQVGAAEALVAQANCGPGEWIKGVEEVVRGVKPHEIHKLLPLVRLPPLNVQDQRLNKMLWPAQHQHVISMPPELARAAAAAGDEARRVSEEVERRRREEAGSARRRIS
jgi:hypothetical protein